MAVMVFSFSSLHVVTLLNRVWPYKLVHECLYGFQWIYYSKACVAVVYSVLHTTYFCVCPLVLCPPSIIHVFCSWVPFWILFILHHWTEMKPVIYNDYGVVVPEYVKKNNTEDKHQGDSSSIYLDWFLSPRCYGGGKYRIFQRMAHVTR